MLRVLANRLVNKRMPATRRESLSGDLGGVISSASLSEEVRRFDFLLYGFLALVVTILVLAMLNLQSEIEAGVITFTDLLPVGYAFGAGMVASVNPCGFFLLPTYVSYQLGTNEAGYYEAPRFTRLVRAFILGGIATLGFVLLFAAIGTVLGLGGTRLVGAFPYAGVAIGAAMAGGGAFLLLTRRTLRIGMPDQVIVARRRNQRNVFLFGLGYATASLSCTLPIFLVVVGTSVAAGSWLSSLAQFVGYALGMGTVLISVTLGSALFRDAVAANLRRAIPLLSRASSLFLIAAGGYVLYYWLFYANYFF